MKNASVGFRYKDLPRKYLRSILDNSKQGQGTLDDFVHHANCLRCDEKTQKGACLKCDSDLLGTASYLLQSAADCGRKLEAARQVTKMLLLGILFTLILKPLIIDVWNLQICEECSADDDKCINTDCPVFHKVLRYERDEYYNCRQLIKLKEIEYC
jgi:hypothetical protein